jgi:hypothetical protein
MSDMFNNDEPTQVSEEVVAPEVVAEAPVEDVIEAPVEAPVVEESPIIEEPAAEPAMVQALAPVANGVMGVTSVPKSTKKPATKKAKTDTVAVYSTRNVSWTGVGKVYRGINIVSKEESEKWITRDHCRIASPEEVAKEFGK